MQGDIAQIGNTLLTCPDTDPRCAEARERTGTVPRNNDSYAMTYVNVEDPAEGWFNASSAVLDLPDDAEVLWAGLYWGGDVSGGGDRVLPPDRTLRREARLVVGAATPLEVEADVYDQRGTSVNATPAYQAFVDVTPQLQAAGSGTYTVGNVQASTGTRRSPAGRS